jgi:hypothetical protein
MAHLQTAQPAWPQCRQARKQIIDKLPAINFVKYYLDEVLDGLKHQQRLGGCFERAVAMHISWLNCANIRAAKGAYL